MLKFLMNKKLRLNCAELNLFLLRLKNSQRLFIHKSLLFSLGVGNLVFVLDKTLFASREDHPVSEVFSDKMKEMRLSTRTFRRKLVRRCACSPVF